MILLYPFILYIHSLFVVIPYKREDPGFSVGVLSFETYTNRDGLL